MKRIFNYILLLLFIIPGTILGQVLSDTPEPGGGGELDGIICRNKDYQFKIEDFQDNFFFTGKTAFVCTRNLPVNMTIVDAVNQNPIVPLEIRWSKNGVDAPSNSNLLKIIEADFANNISQVEIIVIFSLPQQGSVELKLKLQKNGVKFNEELGKYAFDDNKIEQYNTEYEGIETLNTPWNFLLMNGEAEVLNAEITKKKGIYAVPGIIAAGVDWLNIAPDEIAPNIDADISFDANLLLPDDRTIAIQACDEKSELFLYAGGMKTYDIRVFQVCERDDDVREIPRGTANLDPMAVCISAGLDGTIDLWGNQAFYEDQGDLVFNGNTIIAGVDGICNSRMVREPENGDPAGPNLNLSDCTPLNVFDVEGQLVNMNTLSSKIGVVYTKNIFNIETIGINFDASMEDGLVSNARERESLATGIELLAGPVPANSIFTYLVSDLGTSNSKTVAGKATSLGSSKLVLDIVDADHTNWFHEVGHAFSSLRHPDERVNNIPTVNYLTDDKSNFMYSEKTGRTSKVRRYQFGFMRR